MSETETLDEQLSRLHLIASLDRDCDMSDNDLAALRAVLMTFDQQKADLAAVRAATLREVEQEAMRRSVAFDRCGTAHEEGQQDALNALADWCALADVSITREQREQIERLADCREYAERLEAQLAEERAQRETLVTALRAMTALYDGLDDALVHQRVLDKVLAARAALALVDAPTRAEWASVGVAHPLPRTSQP